MAIMAVSKIKTATVVSPDTAPNKVGRPTDYSLELAAKICEEISFGNSLRSICRRDDMPVASTVFRWIHEKKDFKEQYDISIEERTTALGEDLLDIADDGHNDWMQKRYGEDVSWITNGEALQRSRLRVDTRKWIMSKMRPQKYGDKLDVTSDGKQLPTPIYGGKSANIKK